MTNITIFGKGNMGRAIGGTFEDSGNIVNYITSDSEKTTLGDIVILAVPYSAVSNIIETYKEDFKYKIIIDITNPVNFDTFDDLVIPSNTSAATIIAKSLPDSYVIKGFNTTFANTLVTKKVAGEHQTTVLLAGDDENAKFEVTKALDGSGLAILDAGSLKRAHELEAMGFLQITLAGAEKISWESGFGIFK